MVLFSSPSKAPFPLGLQVLFTALVLVKVVSKTPLAARISQHTGSTVLHKLIASTLFPQRVVRRKSGTRQEGRPMSGLPMSRRKGGGRA